jgi:hypothetical protein
MSLSLAIASRSAARTSSGPIRNCRSNGSSAACGLADVARGRR